MDKYSIIYAVITAAKAAEIEVKEAAFQCLVKMVSLYYQFLGTTHMNMISNLTIEAVNSSEDKVALQGFHFWSTVCKEEMDLEIKATRARKMDWTPKHLSKFYAQDKLATLVPILLQTLIKQEDFSDKDERNPCGAASACLRLLATC